MQHLARRRLPLYLCVTSGFRCEADENCALLGYYAASSGNLLPTFRNVLTPEGVTDRLSRKSVRNYHYSLHNNREERSSQCQYSLAHTQTVDLGPRAADCTRAPPDSGVHPPCLWALCPRQTGITSIRLLLFWGPGSDLGHISQNHSLSMRSWFEFKLGSKCQLRNLRGVPKSWQLVAEVKLTS